MDTLLFVGLFLLFLAIVYRLISKQKKLPPGPPSLPIIGHLHLLKRPLHLYFHNLSNKYGPIIFFRFGPRPVLVISDPSAIEECFTKNDIVFANRPLFPSRKVLDYDFTRPGAAPYGDHWRNLRRLMTTELFSSTRLQMSSSIRTEEIHFLIKQLLRNCMERPQSIEIGLFFYTLTFNVIMQAVAGYRHFDDGFGSDNIGGKIKDLMEIFNPDAKLLTSDHFPILRWLTFRETQKEIMEVHVKREKFLKDLIDTRRISTKTSGERRTLIEVLCSLQESEPEIYTENVIKGTIADVLIGGTVTSKSTMESAVSHLIAYPEAFNKAREEIDNNIDQFRLLDESDLPKLYFLHCIISETIRLGSTGPIIPPHESSEKCTVGGYDIPRGTMLLVNTLTLYRDPKLWEDPDLFKPGRFQVNEVEKGASKFIPFGLGRRQCPGAGLAMRVMALSLGTLIQCFDLHNADLNGPKDGPVRVIFRPREGLASALCQH